MKRNSVSLALACTLVLLLGSASLSQADQIVITAGSFLQMDATRGSLELAGDRGFTLSTRVNESEGLFVPGQQCLPASPVCPPGSTLSLTATWVGSGFGPGTATLDGQSYSLGIGDTDASAFVEFTGSVVLPPLVGDSAFVSAPFLFRGLLAPPDAPRVALMGRGTATLALFPSDEEDNPGHWALSSARYEFEPIPEPGTMFLVGGGLAVLAARARKRRSGSRP